MHVIQIWILNTWVAKRSRDSRVRENRIALSNIFNFAICNYTNYSDVYERALRVACFAYSEYLPPPPLRYNCRINEKSQPRDGSRERISPEIISRAALRVHESAAKFINARLAYHYRLNQLIVAYNYAAYYIPLSHLNARTRAFLRTIICGVVMADCLSVAAQWKAVAGASFRAILSTQPGETRRCADCESKPRAKPVPRPAPSHRRGSLRFL